MGIALLNGYVSKATFLLIVTIWNALAVYIPIHFDFATETVILIVGIGNAVIVWLGTESGHSVKGQTVKN